MSKDIFDGFKFRGAVPSGRESAAVSKVKGALDKLPLKEVMDLRSLCAILKMSRHTVEGIGPDPALVPYRVKVGNKMIWGNPKTIQELKRRLDA